MRFSPEPEFSAQDHGHDLSLCQDYYWPTADQYTQPYPSCVMGQDNSFVGGTAAFEAPTATPALTGNSKYFSLLRL